MKTHNQFGRSLIEMLCVLAVIGVLSIGGLAAYKYAMSKDTANKVIDIVSVANADMQLGVEPDDPPTIKGVDIRYTGQYKGAPYAIVVDISDHRACQLFKDLASEAGWLVEGNCTD